MGLVRGREHRWGLVAVVASASLHAAFAAYIATRPADAPRARPVEIEFVFEDAPKPVVPEPTPEPPPEPVKPPPARPPPAKVAAVRPPPRVEPPSPPPVSDVPRAEDVPAAAPPLDVPRVATSLLPSATIVIRVDAGVPGADVEVVTGKLAALNAPSANELVANLTKETLGKGRVDRGLVHPYYGQLGKALLKNWDADRVASSGLNGFFEQTQKNMKEFNRIWQERAAEYGGSGNPMSDTQLSNNRKAPTNERIQGLTGVDLEQRKEMSRHLKEQFKATRRAVIRVVQNADGRLTKVELVQPSQDEKVDQEALQDVKLAAQKLPPPPAEALEGRASLSSLWSFELIVSISPPVPTFSFEFDEALGYIDARLPLDRRIYKKVRLVAVE